MDVGTVGFGGADLVVMGVVGTAEAAEGPADSMHHFLDMVLCEHESPRDQNVVGVATDISQPQQQQQRQQPTVIASASISR